VPLPDCFDSRLGGRVGVGPAEDVRVAEGASTHLLYGRSDGIRLLGHLMVDGVFDAPWLLRLGHRPTGQYRLVVERETVGVDGGAVGGPADVVPHRGPIGAGGRRIDVIAQELRGQVVLAAAPWIPARAAVDLGEAADGAPAGAAWVPGRPPEGAPAAEVGVLDHPNQFPWRESVVGKGGGKGVVHH